jgi:hypothetical protein
MNERIRELALQAGAQGIVNRDFIDVEKFAELIVQECAEVTQDFVDHRFPASEYPIRLKRYFGVA